jgi:sulfur-oxidizing protein SoxA
VKQKQLKLKLSKPQGSFGMRDTLSVALAFVISSSVYAESAASDDYQAKVNADIEAFQSFYKKRFYGVELADFANGVYAIDKPSRDQWLEIEEFPPYELSIDEGAELYATAFANGKGYADCFGDVEEQGVRHNYPYFDKERGEVVTLELAINECRVKHGEQPLSYGRGDIANISAYISYQSRDEVINITIDNEAAYNAYQKGKQLFYTKRGQLNFSCADCHMKSTGRMLRADMVSPALGHTTGFPAYRGAWDEIGTLHSRYEECNRNVRALPFALQSQEYRNLEFFQTVLSNNLPFNGPSSRK